MAQFPVGQKPMEFPDSQRLIHIVSCTGLFARMMAYPSANAGCHASTVAGLAASFGSGAMNNPNLADSGYYVYIVEKTPAIGGVMAQLDKTFPTSDCSMCILSPYLVETGRHQNIELVTYADVESVEGYPGNFKVKVKKKARSILTDRCTGCRSCVDNCPVSWISDFPES